MQDTGNMRQCWRMNTLACEVASSLRGCSPADMGIESKESILCLHLAYIRCYIFDTVLSANMYQPACLKELGFDEGLLDSSLPGHAVLITLLAFARVSETIIQETKKYATPSQMNRLDTAHIAQLKNTMRGIHGNIDKVRNSVYFLADSESITKQNIDADVHFGR